MEPVKEEMYAHKEVPPCRRQWRLFLSCREKERNKSICRNHIRSHKTEHTSNTDFYFSDLPFYPVQYIIESAMIHEPSVNKTPPSSCNDSICNVLDINISIHPKLPPFSMTLTNLWMKV